MVNTSESAYFESDDFSQISMYHNLPMTEEYLESEMSQAPPMQDMQELTEMFSEFGNAINESADNDAIKSH